MQTLHFGLSSFAELPDRPVLAADDVDIAWQLLLDDTAAARTASVPPVPAVSGAEAPVDAGTEPPTTAPADQGTGSGG